MTVKDAICFVKNLGEILTSQTLHPSIEKPMLDGQAELLRCGGGERRRLARAVLESMDAIKLDAVVYPSWNNPPPDRHPQFAARQVARRATKP